MGKIKAGNYIVIQSFMVNELKLKGTELLIYAIIFGFSQEESQTFNGGLQYLIEWTNSSKQCVINNLKDLINKGLIEKEEKIVNNVKYCEYRVTYLTSGKKSLPNNISISNISNNNNNIYNIRLKKLTSGKKSLPPTLEDIQSYIKEKNLNVDGKQFYDYFTTGNWIDSKGNKVKNWKQKLITWNSYKQPKQEKTNTLKRDFGNLNQFYM